LEIVEQWVQYGLFGSRSFQHCPPWFPEPWQRSGLSGLAVFVMIGYTPSLGTIGIIGNFDQRKWKIRQNNQFPQNNLDLSVLNAV
jgi:hypothetical protein